MPVKESILHAAKTVKNKASAAKDTVVELADSVDLVPVLEKATKIPGVRVDREKFLRKELKIRYTEEIVNAAVDKNPAFAGISREAVDEIAKKAIQYETNKVSAVSTAAGMPGGIAMAATIPADITQYFAFILRILQKLAYLYGFEEFDLKEDQIDEDTLNRLLIFLGVMFGSQEANAAIKVLAKVVAAQVEKKLARAALTKGVVYPIVKSVAKTLGIQMNKQIFAKAVGGAVPVIGGVMIGGITYGSFKINANRLRKTLSELPISDPNFYIDPSNYQNAEAFKEAIDVDFEEID